MSFWSAVTAWFKDLFTMTKPELEEDIDMAEAVIAKAKKGLDVVVVLSAPVAPGVSAGAAAAGAALTKLDAVAQAVEVKVKGA